MTTHELAKELLDGPDRPVMLSVDGEGNHFSGVSEVGYGFDPDEETEITILWPY